MKNKKIITIGIVFLLICVIGFNSTKIVQAAAKLIQANTSTRQVFRVQDHSAKCGWVAPNESCTMTWTQGHSNAEYPTARCVVNSEWNNGVTQSNLKVGAKVHQEYIVLTAFKYDVVCENNSNKWVNMDIKATTVLR